MTVLSTTRQTMTITCDGVTRSTITIISQSVRIMAGISDGIAVTIHMPTTDAIRRIMVPMVRMVRMVRIVVHRKFTSDGHS